jgi:4-hydroxybenzoate polyprenyltransferase
MAACLRLLRVPHYIKNILVFMPMFFSKNAVKPGIVINAVLGFIIFSTLASIVYIINDIRDKEKDSLHKTKHNRPIASGNVSINEAARIAVVLLIISILLLILLTKQSSSVNVYLASGILALYAAMNLGYSFGLKNIPIIDISILAAGYVLRVIFGAALAGVEVSVWLYLTVTLVAFYMGLGKRRNEIAKQEAETRSVMRFYTHAFLDKNMYVCQGLCVVFYALWSFDSKTIERFHTNAFIYTIPLVFVLFLKYSLNLEGDTDGDPITVLLHDKVLCVLVILYAVATFAIVYL